MNTYRDNIELYYRDVKMPGGWTHNLPDTLQMINSYYWSKFRNAKMTDSDYLFFANITKYPIDIARKYLDIDTRDIVTVPTHGKELRVFILQEDLKQHLKSAGWDKLLNENNQNFPKYGHVVLKKSKGRFYPVQIENLRVDPSVNWMKDSEFVYEVHLWTKRQIKEHGIPTDEIADRKERKFLVYECYEKSEKGYTRKFVVDVWKRANEQLAGIEELVNRRFDFAPTITLKEEEISESAFPYREVKFEHVPGRWLGYGYVEYLEPNQIAENEAENIERKNLAISSLRLFQTRDSKVAGSNILQQSESGDIIYANSELNPVATEERNLPAMNAARDRNMAFVERKTFATDITRGANLPSRTPIGVAELQAGQVESFYSTKKEELGIFYKDLIFNDIFPSFKKENAKMHKLTLSAMTDSLDAFDNIVAQIKVDYANDKNVQDTGFNLTDTQKSYVRDNTISELKKKKTRNIDIPAYYYDNAEFYLDIIITDEAMDVGVKSQLVSMALQTINNNPNVFVNPVSRSVFFKLLGLGGISPHELGIDESSIQQYKSELSQLQPGGSLAASAPAGPVQTSNVL